jgi:hypothetical protein
MPQKSGVFVYFAAEACIHRNYVTSAAIGEQQSTKIIYGLLTDNINKSDGVK